MTTNEYMTLLKHPKWQEKRLRVFKRAGWRCEICGADTICLCVHHGHYIYGRAPWEYEDTVLYSLCERCHEPAEPLRKELKSLLGYIHPINYAFVIEQIKKLNGYTPEFLEKLAERRARRLRLVKYAGLEREKASADF